MKNELNNKFNQLSEEVRYLKNFYNNRNKLISLNLKSQKTEETNDNSLTKNNNYVDFIVTNGEKKNKNYNQINKSVFKIREILDENNDKNLFNVKMPLNMGANKFFCGKKRRNNRINII